MTKTANRDKTIKTEATKERVKVIKANGKTAWVWRVK